jgi:DNA-binding CsgD family transcriptional regulator
MKGQPEGRRDASACAALDGCDLVIDGERYRYLAVALRPAAECGQLTHAERDVARRAALGQRARDIAAARGTSTRTVDHQLASIFRKLKIASRSELAAAIFAGDRSDEPPV